MIYTVTLNPALDHMIQLDHLTIGCVNKMNNDYYLPGGKGINVSIILNNLDTTSIALGFLGGFSGNEIERLLKEKGIYLDMVKIKDNTRINVKIKSEQETEVNGLGPRIDAIDIQHLKDKLNQLNDEDILVLSGSIPKNMDSTIYWQLANASKAKVIVDTTGDTLLKTLECKPFLIKPNIDELTELFDKVFTDLEDVYQHLLILQAKGAHNIIVSMSKDGALFLNQAQQLYYCPVVKGVVKNSVGAGDSMVGGFIHQYIQTNDTVEAFKFSCATGSASVFSENLALKEDILKVLDKQTIIRLK